MTIRSISNTTLCLLLPIAAGLPACDVDDEPNTPTTAASEGASVGGTDDGATTTSTADGGAADLPNSESTSGEVSSEGGDASGDAVDDSSDGDSEDPSDGGGHGDGGLDCVEEEDRCLMDVDCCFADSGFIGCVEMEPDVSYCVGLCISEADCGGGCCINGGCAPEAYCGG